MGLKIRRNAIGELKKACQNFNEVVPLKSKFMKGNLVLSIPYWCGVIITKDPNWNWIKDDVDRGNKDNLPKVLAMFPEWKPENVKHQWKSRKEWYNYETAAHFMYQRLKDWNNNYAI